MKYRQGLKDKQFSLNWIVTRSETPIKRHKNPGFKMKID